MLHFVWRFFTKIASYTNSVLDLFCCPNIFCWITSSNHEKFEGLCLSSQKLLLTLMEFQFSYVILIFFVQTAPQIFHDCYIPSKTSNSSEWPCRSSQFLITKIASFKNCYILTNIAAYKNCFLQKIASYKNCYLQNILLTKIASYKNCFLQKLLLTKSFLKEFASYTQKKWSFSLDLLSYQNCPSNISKWIWYSCYNISLIK